MSENSKIEWTDHTFNPWEGCTKIGPGCDHCYAETRNARFAGGASVNWGAGAPRRRTSAANWKKPLAWSMANFVECEVCGHRGAGVPWRDVGPNMGIIDDGHQCAACGSRSVEPTRARVFCASLADVFDNEVDPEWRADLFQLIEATPNLDWLLLTKRIGNAAGMIVEALSRISYGNSFAEMATKTQMPAQWPWPNVWLGATIVNQAEADRDIPKLLAVPAARRFLSMEPLLGAVDLTATPAGDVMCRCAGCMEMTPHSRLDWIIVGGESGPGARPMSPDWARGLRDQCAAAGVPFLFKQWGEWLPMLGQVEGVRVREKTETSDGWVMGYAGKKAAGRLLDGIEHNGFPEAV